MTCTSALVSGLFRSFFRFQLHNSRVSVLDLWQFQPQLRFVASKPVSCQNCVFGRDEHRFFTPVLMLSQNTTLSRKKLTTSVVNQKLKVILSKIRVTNISSDTDKLLSVFCATKFVCCACGLIWCGKRRIDTTNLCLSCQKSFLRATK